MGFTYTAASLEAQVLQELGGEGVSSKQQTAIRNALREGLIDIWQAGLWSWRKRRMTVTLTASTPYHELPSDYDAMSLSEIYRTDSDDDAHFMVQAPDAVFERNYYGASSGEPAMFRITRSTVGGTYVSVLEGAPPPDDTYTYADVEYFCSATPVLSFTSGTVADTTPNMPTEFHDIWHQRALADAANVLGQTEKSAYHMALYDKKLEKAKSRRDTDTPKGPMRTPTIPYSDMGRLRWPGC